MLSGIVCDGCSCDFNSDLVLADGDRCEVVVIMVVGRHNMRVS